MNQDNSQCAIKLVFTPEQFEEQKKFVSDLENNVADIVFEGTILEAKSYLAGIEHLVDSSIH